MLVVEADPEVQEQMARALRRRGLRVVGTSSGDGALALILAWEVDLILISEDLPGRNGVEVTRLIHQARPGARICVLATSPEPEVQEAAIAAGAMGCVRKPLELSSLGLWLAPETKALESSSAVAE